MTGALATPALRLLLVAFAAAVLLHADRAPVWCTVTAAAAMLWRWVHQRGGLPLPGRFLRAGLTLLLLGGVLVTFRSLGGLAAGSALLMVMGAAKLLETRGARDALVVVLVSITLVLAAALDRQSLLRVPLYLLTFWLALAALTLLASRAGSARPAFATSGRTLLLALPFAALCFVLVPRMAGPLWAMPPGSGGTTGLSDEMSPGSIGELSISSDIAFRVRFEGPAPPPAQRYWRGPVLHDFDGFTWRRVPGQVAVRQEPDPVSPPVRYHVMLEPHGRIYLFGLDSIARLDARRSFRTFDGQVLAQRPVTAAIAYDGVSYLDTRYTGPLSILARRLDTRLPPDRNPRTLALAQTLRAGSSSDRDYADRVLEYFRSAGFTYTLEPPLLGPDSVDDLVFGSRLGFCGHFASAYATLMRAASIPARVVTGYQGGAWNPIGGYYTVRQSEAHAWTEVWFDGEGWVRIDPTAVVAPGRLERGLAEVLPESRSAADTLLGRAAWLRNLRDAWDAAGSWWQESVVSFNRAAQRDLLSRLGLGDLDYRQLVLLLTIAALLWGVALLGFLARLPHGARPDAAGREWQRLLTLLARRGAPQPAHAGPLEVARAGARQLPEAADDIQALAADYCALRFGPPRDPAATALLLRAMRRRLRSIGRARAAGHRRRTAPAARG